MNELTKFFWQVYHNSQLRSYNDRFIPIMEIDDVVIVNFTPLFNRDYSTMGMDQLMYQVDKIGAGKRFIFVFEDGTNPLLSGGTKIINYFITQFNLNPTTCVIFARGDRWEVNATFVGDDSILLWIAVLNDTIKHIPISTNKFTKKFAVWFHRGTFYRLQIARQLYTNYREESYISYQETGMLHNYRMAQYFEDDIAWADANTPIVYDQIFPNRQYTHDMIVGNNRKPYHDYFMEIIVETDCISNNWLTEKTIKNLYIGKPFIMMGGAHSLDKLQQFGFKTFSQWFNESYDQIENSYLRLEAIKKEIDRIAMLSIDELNNIYQDMMPVLEYNRQHYIQLLNAQHR